MLVILQTAKVHGGRASVSWSLDFVAVACSVTKIGLIFESLPRKFSVIVSWLVLQMLAMVGFPFTSARSHRAQATGSTISNGDAVLCIDSKSVRI